MKTNKLIIAAFASLILFAYSCSDENKGANDAHVHTEGDGHNHIETVAVKANITNEEGQLIDAAGNLITGCPTHKEMVGSVGDKCPKCNYMEMVPVTWSLEGIDTVRVTNLPDYNPLK